MLENPYVLPAPDAYWLAQREAWDEGSAARLAWVLDTLRDEQCVRAFEAVFYRGMSGLDAEAPEPESYEALQAIGAFLERAAGGAARTTDPAPSA